MGLLELTALPSIEKERWVPWVQEADVLLVDGGDALYLCHWMRESGFVELMPSLSETVWVGVSAGSMVMTPRIGDRFVRWTPPAGGEAVAAHERLVLDAGGVVVRYGTFYGPGTYSESGGMPPLPRIHVDEAARRTLPLLGAPSGVVVIAEEVQG